MALFGGATPASDALIGAQTLALPVILVEVRRHNAAEIMENSQSEGETDPGPDHGDVG